MKNLLLAFILLLALGQRAAAQSPAEQPLCIGQTFTLASKVLGDVIHDPWIAFNTWAAAHGAWAYHDQIKRTAEAVIGRHR